MTAPAASLPLDFDPPPNNQWCRRCHQLTSHHTRQHPTTMRADLVVAAPLVRDRVRRRYEEER